VVNGEKYSNVPDENIIKIIWRQCFVFMLLHCLGTSLHTLHSLRIISTFYYHAIQVGHSARGLHTIPDD